RSDVITALQKLTGELPFAASNLQNRRSDRNTRRQKLQRLARCYISRPVCNEIEHSSFEDRLAINEASSGMITDVGVALILDRNALISPDLPSLLHGAMAISLQSPVAAIN